MTCVSSPRVISRSSEIARPVQTCVVVPMCSYGAFMICPWSLAQELGGHVESAPKRDLRNTSPEVRGGWRLINRRQIKPDPGPLWPTLKRGMGEPRAARFVGCRFEGSWLPYPASKILPETWVGGAGKRPRDGPPCRKSAKYSLHAHQTRSYLPGPIQRAADCRDPRNHSCAGGGGAWSIEETRFTRHTA